MKKETADRIHMKVIPRLHAVLWLIALAISACGYDGYLKGEDVLVKLCGIFVVFIIFIWESAINFLDLRVIHNNKNFSGEILETNALLFAIIPLSFIFGVWYYIANDWAILFLITLLMMGWLKYEFAYFANNIERYCVNIKPTFTPNSINNVK